MNILFLAPQPFYEERGTPIAVDRVLRVLSAREEEVALVTYHQGSARSYPHVQHHRAPDVPFVRRVRPGFSWEKVICDLAMLPVVAGLTFRKRYTLVHAVEESVFMALMLKLVFRVPYIYDMDSSLSQQIGEKYPAARPLVRLLAAAEGFSIRHARAVVPVCESLAQHIASYRPRQVVILPDVSLLQPVQAGQVENLRKVLGITGTLILYVGNLETYQGIDLLLDSFALVASQSPDASLVIIGGEAADCMKYQERCHTLGVERRVFLIGPRPVEHLAGYLAQADILVSPRIKGTNTPMKVYSYLDSGKAVLATDLPTHTQVLTNQVAQLAAAGPASFAKALLMLVQDPALRERLGQAGRQLVRDAYSPAAFNQKLNHLYDDMRRELVHEEPAPGTHSATLIDMEK
jgi:glycosyltransferase involved in cell wall biosynthesis